MALGLSQDRYNEFGELRRGDTPFAVTIVSRFLGWIALSVWLGGLSVTYFYISPVVAESVAYVPLLLKHDDWKARIVGYAHTGTLNQVEYAGLYCFLLLILAAYIESRSWSGNKIVRWLPGVLVAAVGAALISTIDLRLDVLTASQFNYVDRLDALNNILLVQMSLLGALAFVFVWMQSVPKSVQEEANRD